MEDFEGGQELGKDYWEEGLFGRERDEGEGLQEVEGEEGIPQKELEEVVETKIVCFQGNGHDQDKCLSGYLPIER